MAKERKDLNEREYVVRLNGRQLFDLSRAAELVARLRLGQLDKLKWFFQEDGSRPKWDDSVTNHWVQGMTGQVWDLVQVQLNNIKALVWPEYPTNGGPGIHNETVPEEARILYDLHQVFRHKLHWDTNPEGTMQVWYDEPHKTSTQEPLAKVEDAKYLEEALKAIQEGNLRHALLSLQEAMGMYEVDKAQDRQKRRHWGLTKNKDEEGDAPEV